MIRKNKITVCFDIDGVICCTKGLNYDQSIPIKKNINKINQLYRKGYIIKIFTARYMGRSKEKVLLAKKRGLKSTSKQLKEWKVKYHKLIFGKPVYDLFVDDRNLFHKNNWIKKIDDVLINISANKN